MPPVVQAMVVAAAIMLPVVLFILVISIAMVKRGESITGSVSGIEIRRAIPVRDQERSTQEVRRSEAL